jgi:hypothetical protein
MTLSTDGSGMALSSAVPSRRTPVGSSVGTGRSDKSGSIKTASVGVVSAASASTCVAISSLDVAEIISSVRDAVEDTAEDSMEGVAEDAVEDGVEDAVEDEVEDGVGDGVDNAVDDAVDDAVDEIAEDFLEDVVEGMVEELVEDFFVDLLATARGNLNGSPTKVRGFPNPPNKAET